MTYDGMIRRLREYAYLLFGSAVYAFAFDIFFVPHQFNFGGVTGFSQVLHAIFGFPSIGVFVILTNLPLFFFSFFAFGPRVLFRSLLSMAFSSVLIDALPLFLDFPVLDPLLSAVYGGVFVGFGLGLVLLSGATTGGTDLAAGLLRLKFPYIPMGTALLILDCAIIVGSAVVFRTLDSLLYGFLSLYLCARVIDKLLYGGNNAKVAVIISDEHEAIGRAVMDTMGRGVTLLHGEGGYTHAGKRVLLCAVKKRQVVVLKELVRKIDPNSFFILCDAQEVLGDGFGSHQKSASF